jgi:hypothetical protein
MDATMLDAESVTSQLLDMPDTLLLHVLCQLGAFAGVAACCCCCHRLNELGADNLVWSPLCAKQFGLREARSPPSAGGGSPCTSFWQAARAWTAFASSLRLDQFRDADGMLSTLAPSTLAAADTWAKLERWCASNLPEIAETLAPPATQAAWDSFQTTVLGPTPTDTMRRALLPLRLLTSIHNGQDLSYDLLMAAPSGAIEPDDPALLALSEATDVVNRQRSLGLLGGYSAYDILVSSRLYPLRLMAGWTCLLRRRMPTFGASQIVIGASFDLSKHISLDLESGWILIGGLRREGETPVSALPLTNPAGAADTGALLAWLGEYASRLSAGEFGAADLVPLSPITHGISLMPRKGGRCATAVTRGIEVTASAVHAHEHGMVIYSLGIRLLMEGEEGCALGQYSGLLRLKKIPPFYLAVHAHDPLRR